MAAGSRIKRSVGPVRRRSGRRNFCGNLLAAAEAGIDQTQSLEAAEGLLVKLEMLGLAAHRLLPGEPEPGQIFIDRPLEFRAAPALVDILDAEQKAASGLARRPISGEGGEGMAQMQAPRGAGCEAGNRFRIG